eukprot:TRINITY_DN34409_c0_g1_i1.p1 TRINITY_DN34409_c0_g1~~TRINITY_DN34409_c0_g1_i1.p1  ORF type:complete len:196 (+),score=30.47 TRINITY_DN34409_c0_g1_i1:79-666(+)
MPLVHVCVRNLPNKVLEADVQKVLHDFGLDVACYSISMPKKKFRQQMNNFGYGFIACRGQEDAQVLMQLLQGYQFERIASRKKLELEISTSKELHRFPASLDGHADSSPKHMDLPGTSTGSLEVARSIDGSGVGTLQHRALDKQGHRVDKWRGDSLIDFRPVCFEGPQGQSRDMKVAVQSPDAKEVPWTRLMTFQ